MQGRGYREGGVGKRSQLVGNVREYGKGYAEGGVGRGRGKTRHQYGSDCIIYVMVGTD